MPVPATRRLFAEVLSGPRRLAGGRITEHGNVVNEAGLIARLLRARPAVSSLRA